MVVFGGGCVIYALTDSDRPSVYWTAMKARVKGEAGIESSTICRQLKLKKSQEKKFILSRSRVFDCGSD